MRFQPWWIGFGIVVALAGTGTVVATEGWLELGGLTAVVIGVVAVLQEIFRARIRDIEEDLLEDH
ncbi:MAG: hypothetical protein ABEJ58_06990 [Halodesulfurarchaeum sp.]